MAAAMSPSPLKPWTPDKKHTDMERWVCIYPAYLNSKKTRKEGRRLPKASCVENPTYQEIRDVLSVLKLSIGVEYKMYSRERSKELPFIGRIRVQLKNDDGTPNNANFPTRDSILLYLGGVIPQLKTRQGGGGGSAGASGSGGSGRFNDMSQGNQNPSGSGGGGGGGGGKKGKGKRR